MIRVRRGRGCLLAHCAILSLNSRCLNVSHAARLTCQGVICTRFEDEGSRMAFSGMRSSLKKASHQLECIKSGARHSWYAFFSHMLSSSQLRGDDLSRAVRYIHPQRQKRMGAISCTCHAGALDTLRRDPSQTRQPSAAFPAAQTAMGSLRAPHLPGAGEPKTASTWTTSGGGRVREGAVV
jgi:hypothetical protein